MGGQAEPQADPPQLDQVVLVVAGPDAVAPPQQVVDQADVLGHEGIDVAGKGGGIFGEGRGHGGGLLG
jgi:hypothetical protein